MNQSRAYNLGQFFQRVLKTHFRNNSFVEIRGAVVFKIRLDDLCPLYVADNKLANCTFTFETTLGGIKFHSKAESSDTDMYIILTRK